MFSVDTDTTEITGLLGVNPKAIARSDGDILESFGANQLLIGGVADPVVLPTLVSVAGDNLVIPLDMSVDQGRTPAETDSHIAPSVDSLTGIALANSYEQLQQFANSPEFLSQMSIAFGDDFDVEAAQDLADSLTNGTFEIPPTTVVSAADINGANGAFAAETNNIYLSSEFVAENADNPEAIVSVLLEEIGHYIDSQINISDTPGDEGAIFSGVVQGREFDAGELEALMAIDDTATVSLNGEEITIEESSTFSFAGSYRSSHQFTKNRGGWTNNNDYPRLLADVNRDGRADIIGFGRDNVFVSLGKGDGTFHAPVTSSPGFTKNRGGWTDNNNYPRLVGDVNGNGRADIVGFGSTDVFVSFSNTNGTFGTPRRSQPSSSNGFTKNRGGWTDNNNYPRLLADVNGDGKADIIGFGRDNVFVSLGKGDGTFHPPVASSPGFTKNRGGWTDNNNYPRLVGDVNGDGRADIVGFGATDVFVSFGNANGTFGTPRHSQPSSSNGFTKNRGGWTDNNNYPRLLADVNQDGRADIIGFGANDVFVSLSKGDGTFHAPVSYRPTPGFTKNRSGWTDNNNYPRLVGDLNGDRRADIVGFGAADVFASLANVSSVVTPPPSSGSRYQLPYPDGRTYQVTQGNNGGFSHNNLYNRYAWDFYMPVGHTVVATRDGRVVSLYEGSQTTLSSAQNWEKYTNYVVIDHGDGTSALYAHLEYNSVLPNVGDYVRQNQPIAQSGNTGHSTAPHLHYSVQRTPSSIPPGGFRNSRGYWTESLPSSFSDPNVLSRNSNGVPTVRNFYTS
ncbi:FG-GAP-like repeat-containing protein [Limnospira platensis]|uniref:FG-GAP-like repeat-containing protein n=1 Tax=Limnospira platensis TaxID=118562 RepID=UPI003D6F47C3